MVSPSASGVPELIAWMADRGHAPALPDDPREMASPAAVASFMAALRDFALELDATEVFLGGQARHVPFGEVLPVPLAAECPQHLARGFFRPVAGADDRVEVPGPLARFSATPCPPPAPPGSEAMTAADEVLRTLVDAGVRGFPRTFIYRRRYRSPVCASSTSPMCSPDRSRPVSSPISALT